MNFPLVYPSQKPFQFLTLKVPYILPKKVYIFCKNLDKTIVYENCEIEFCNYINIFNILKNSN